MPAVFTVIEDKMLVEAEFVDWSRTVSFPA